MILERWDPFKEFRRLDRNRYGLSRGILIGDRIDHWALPVDVFHDGDNIVVQASIPGVAPEDIQVTIEEGVLGIKVERKAENEERDGNYLRRERRSGRFQRALRLPDTVDVDKAETRYDQGVLTVTLPKIEAKKAKRLEVKAA